MNSNESSYKDHIYALIYCGGSGTRLWPYSTEKAPKQFLSFDGEKTLLRRTFERIKKIFPLDHIFVISLPDYADEVAKFLPEVPKDQLIIEPARRDTLLAAGYGAVVIRKRDSQAIIANLWSDQLVEEENLYQNALLAGASTAWENNNLVTTGVRPEYAHPGLEYVKKGAFYKEIEGTNVYKVEKFIERPERSGEDPEVVFRDKRTLWHVGLWIWKAEVFLELTKKHTPETYERLMIIESHLNNGSGNEEIKKVYEESPKVQIDMVISKDQTDMYVVEGEYEWLDLGDFNVLWKMYKKDKEFNASLLKGGGEWIKLETEGSFVLTTDKKTVVTVGVKGLIVVSVGDRILVLPRSEAQKVKKVVEKLKEEKRADLL